MKTLRFLNSSLLVIAALLLVTAVFAFVNGNINYGICNILWMGTEIVYFFANKKSIEIEQKAEGVHAFLSDIINIIKKYGTAIITEGQDGFLQIVGCVGVNRGNTSCASEKNENKEFVHNEKGDKE